MIPASVSVSVLTVILHCTLQNGHCVSITADTCSPASGLPSPDLHIKVTSPSPFFGILLSAHDRISPQLNSTHHIILSALWSAGYPPVHFEEQRQAHFPVMPERQSFQSTPTFSPHTGHYVGIFASRLQPSGPLLPGLPPIQAAAPGELDALHGHRHKPPSLLEIGIFQYRGQVHLPDTPIQDK
jgi:hypothetical protein